MTLSSSLFYLWLTIPFIDFVQEGKNFTGSITYNISVLSKNDSIDSKSILDNYGSQMTLTITEEGYFMEFNGSDLKNVRYLKSTNFQYTLRHKQDTIYYRNCGIEPRNIDKISYLSEKISIAGYNCQQIQIRSGLTTHTFSFNSKFRIKPADYRNHQFAFVNEYYRLSQSVYLQYVYETPFYKIIHSAQEISATPEQNKISILPNFPLKEW